MGEDTLGVQDWALDPLELDLLAAKHGCYARADSTLTH